MLYGFLPVKHFFVGRTENANWYDYDVFWFVFDVFSFILMI
jgi:hypothetical protein